MSKALAVKIKRQAAAHELRAAEMLRCAARLQRLARRREAVAAGLHKVAAVLLSGGRAVGRPRKTTASTTAQNLAELMKTFPKPSHMGGAGQRVVWKRAA